MKILRTLGLAGLLGLVGCEKSNLPQNLPSVDYTKPIVVKAQWAVKLVDEPKPHWVQTSLSSWYAFMDRESKIQIELVDYKTDGKIDKAFILDNARHEVKSESYLNRCQQILEDFHSRRCSDEGVKSLTNYESLSYGEIGRLNDLGFGL